MKKLFLLTISISLILFVAGISFAEESGSGANGGTTIEKKVISINERVNQLVAEGKKERVYLSPTPEMEALANEAIPEWRPETEIAGSSQYLGVKPVENIHER